MSIDFDPTVHAAIATSESSRFGGIFQRLNQSMQHAQVVQSTAAALREDLQVDRVVLYYFYRQWEGQVTFDYAQLYLEGRIRAIKDIDTASIEPCLRDFLRYMDVRANLVVPILPEGKLWGLLVAHHCQQPKAWTPAEIDRMRIGAEKLATASSIRGK